MTPGSDTVPTPFDEIGRLPFATDNVAIATQDLESGLLIELNSDLFRLSHAVLEGHRFAVMRVDAGEDLLSWGMPFGRATIPILPGDYVCNDGVLESLLGRNLAFELPASSNFSDKITPFELGQSKWNSAEQVPMHPVRNFFLGYHRGEDRGVGTRNYVVLLGVSSRVSGFTRHLEKIYASLVQAYPNVDGVVAVSHTEGDDTGINNRALLLRTLAGFVVHPNVGAVLLVDDGSETISNKHVLDYILRYKYPVKHVLYETLSLEGRFEKPVAEASLIIDHWLPIVNSVPKTRQPLSTMKIALQCGGSDAFSGISGNPLAGWVAREIISQGGSANLAETDELVGAEPYILKKVKSLEVAERFLETIDRFVRRAERHGSSAAGNPSGGNKYRGLYNIYLKSLGAAMKKHPDVCLDEVIEYGERMDAPGYYFMDSPGNDLESIAGQVASGCNMIYFVTGNGSVTNFPFVPTVKIVTTTRRFELLEEDMDVNAGRYLDGAPMERLGADTLHFTLAVASGRKSAGEKAGHSQVQIWRNWRQPDDEQDRVLIESGDEDLLLEGLPLTAGQEITSVSAAIQGFETVRGAAFSRLGLILPTSLCSGQVARMAVEALNSRDTQREYGIDRFVTLAHTEGCGVSSGVSESIFMRTMYGHLVHPNICKALLLEHGCEKTHNDHFRNYFHQHNLDVSNIGWASIQRGGGIQKTIDYIENWFKQSVPFNQEKSKQTFGSDAIKLGLLIDTDFESTDQSEQIGLLTRSIAAAGGTVIVPRFIGRNNPTLEILNAPEGKITLAYAQPAEVPGLHIMAIPSSNWQEAITGLGAGGVNVFAYLGNNSARTGHPFIPLLQLATCEGIGDVYIGGGEDWVKLVMKRIEETLNGDYLPIRVALENTDFQITRGLYGVSL